MPCHQNASVCKTNIFIYFCFCRILYSRMVESYYSCMRVMISRERNSGWSKGKSKSGKTLLNSRGKQEFVITMSPPLSKLQFCGILPLLSDVLNQGRATFSEWRPDETFQTSSWAGVTNENTKMRMLLLRSRQISETAGAACHGEVCQWPVPWMSATTE